MRGRTPVRSRLEGERDAELQVLEGSGVEEAQDLAPVAAEEPEGAVHRADGGRLLVARGDLDGPGPHPLQALQAIAVQVLRWIRTRLRPGPPRSSAARRASIRASRGGAAGEAARGRDDDLRAEPVLAGTRGQRPRHGRKGVGPGCGESARTRRSPPRGRRRGPGPAPLPRPASAARNVRAGAGRRPEAEGAAGDWRGPPDRRDKETQANRQPRRSVRPSSGMAPRRPPPPSGR